MVIGSLIEAHGAVAAPYTVDAAALTAWRGGKLVFNDVPLGEGIKLPEWDYRKQSLRENFVNLQMMVPRGSEALPLPWHWPTRHWLVSARADENVDSLFQRADAALYQAKNSGRNRIVLA